MKIIKIGIATGWSSYKELHDEGTVSQGWSGSGDLSFLIDKNEKIWDYIPFICKNEETGKVEQRGINAFSQMFRQICTKDDKVIVVAFEGNNIKGICEIPDDFIYFYNSNAKEYKHSLFPVHWINWEDFCKDKNLKGQEPGSHGVRGIENFNKPPQIKDYIEKNWDKYIKENNISIQPQKWNEKLQRLKNELPEKMKKSKEQFLKRIEMEKLKEKNKEFTNSLISLIISNKNLILTGAPGTGKTYLAKQIAAQLILDKEYDEKNALEDNKQFGFVQFHPSFDYTDFVEGLRPTDDGNISFHRKDGIFMEFCRKALSAYKEAKTNNEEAPKYVFVIDEINRGDLSKIFGELFFSIDPGYRGEKGKVKTQYNNLWKAEDLFDSSDFFYVPENVYIIGTMNDIDRSVESMDFAMRRRFAWKEISYNDTESMLDNDKAWEDNLKPSQKDIEKIKERMNNLNLAILTIPGLSRAYQIGAAYFLKLKNYLTSDGQLDENSWKSLWVNHLKGLLFEYLRGMPDSEENLTMLENAYNLDKDNLFEMKDRKVVKKQKDA